MQKIKWAGNTSEKKWVSECECLPVSRSDGVWKSERERRGENECESEYACVKDSIREWVWLSDCVSKRERETNVASGQAKKLVSIECFIQHEKMNYLSHS